MVKTSGKTDGRRSIDTGRGIAQVTTVADWYRQGQFRSDDEARGAFRLAYQQGMDGMGTSVQAWMGLTDAEFSGWMRDDALPRGRRRG